MSRATVKQSQNLIPKSYKPLLNMIKSRIHRAQIKAATAVNRELILLYWEIGSSIYQKQKDEGWGAKTIEKLSKDLKSAFPNMKGISFRNLKYMVYFAKEYPNSSIGQQPVAQIPWGHNILLLQKLTSKDERLWYAQKTIENGWSRSYLLDY